MKATDPLLQGHKPLLHPPFADMTAYERLLRVTLMAYAKHTLDSQHIGYEDLGDALWDEICNALGDDKAILWGDRIKDEANQPDIDDD